MFSFRSRRYHDVRGAVDAEAWLGWPIRFLGMLVARVSYRLQTVGAENLPSTGGALLVCNHVSYIDLMLLMATQKRPIRFLIHESFFRRPIIGYLLRLLKTIPVQFEDDAAQQAAYEEAQREIARGGVICLFAEQSLTRTGYIKEFKKGFAWIAAHSNAPIIPVNLHGVWGSIFSYGQWHISGRIMRWIRGQHVLISFGEPLPPDTTAFQVRQKVLELSAQAFEHEKRYVDPLPHEFVRVARGRWRQFCMADSLGRHMTYGQALTAAILISRLLKAPLKGQHHVGVLMPTCVAGALANIALMLRGKIPVNLNYTASRAHIESSIQQCEIQTIISSAKFAEKVSLSDLDGLLFLEELSIQASRLSKVGAFLKALLLPTRFLIAVEPTKDGMRREPTMDDPATIMFSSGSTGEPKGVILSHYNVLSNAISCRQVLQPAPHQDILCGVLPFFHSFGYSVTIWLALLSGIGVVYHTSPVEATQIGKLVSKYRCTLLISTPTFLMTYVRKIAAESFASLRLVVVGAEKLKPRIAAAFEKKFGICPCEGYGTTELSPVASINLPDVEKGGVFEKAHRAGTIGRPIPGVAMKIVDPNDLDHDLGCDREGMLMVKGPNVMRGYLGKPEATAEIIRGGWYVTGDVARIDHDGFVVITDRLSRFSKIGGEMIPHLGIEEMLQQALGADEQVCAVTSLPDEKKGERIILVLTPEAGDPDKALMLLKKANVPNLWIPNRRNVLQVEQLPVLGSGKLDLKGLRMLAQDKLGA